MGADATTRERIGGELHVTATLSAVLHLLPALGAVPLGGPAEGIAGYLLGYGPLGVCAVALAYVLYKGTFVRAKTADDQRKEAVETLTAQSASLLAEVRGERDRAIARAERAEAQRDEALKVAQEQIVPLLSQFTGVTSALLPVLQQIVARGGLDGR